MNRIAQFAVKYPVTVLMFVLGIVLLGFISFGKLGTDLFPDLNNPKIYIELKAGQKPPEEIEKNYVDQIESLSMRQSDVVKVSSVSQVGSATITVEYDWNKDMDEAFLDLQKEINAFTQNSDLESTNISQYDPNASPVMIVGLKNSSITNMDELRKTAVNYIRNELVRIEGVADVKLTGIEESEVVIETNKYILESFGLTADGIAAQINNYNKNVSGGSIVDMGLKYTVKGVSVLNDLEDMKNIIVGFKQSAATSTTSVSSASTSTSQRVPVYLRDVATLKFENKDPLNIVTINGERCISLSIYKEPKFNTVEVVKSLDKTFADFKKALPGYEFIGVQDQGKYIDNAIKEVKNSTLMGIFLAVAVLYVFLRRIGTTMVISVAIPISIIATFNLMYFSHLTLNIMTLGGLALGAGRLVDDAIVVLENITRNREEGMPLKQAVVEGTGQVGGAITASTLTTIVVFLPIVYLRGASGEMFKDQAWTVAFALISSLFVAMLVIPMLVNVLFNDKKAKSTVKLTSPMQFRWYPLFLSKVLERRILIIILSLVLMIFSALLIPKLGSEFMPKASSAEFTIELTLPEGTSLKRTQSTVIKTEDIIKGILGDKLNLIYSQTGGDNNTSALQSTTVNNENYANLKVFLKKEFATNSDQAISQIEQFLKTIPDLKVAISQEETSLQATLGTNTAPFVVEIKGKEYDQLEKILNESKTILQSNSGLYNMTTSLDEGTPEVEIIIDRFKTSFYNVSVDNVINQLKSYLSGAAAGTFEKDGELKNITIKLGDISLNQLQDLIITAGTVKVPLSELARIKTVNTPREITRSNQSRTTYLYAMVNKTKPFDQIVNEAESSLKTIALPVDYRIDVTGEELKRKETMSNLTFALILSVILVFMVLAAEFESLIQPFVILLTMPFAVVGTILTFLILGKSLNMMAYIGIIMLCGIAVSNAIILIDRINQLREAGLGKKDSIVTAGSQRIRPILMTSLTTIFALVPLTIGIGESASLRSPMALAVVGGLVSSTLLTLVVIPCVYWVFDSFSMWISGSGKVTV
jgi:hydrophobic/amphiphilic exporter-1 (mainly G- bacteria), HAE1 family